LPAVPHEHAGRGARARRTDAPAAGTPFDPGRRSTDYSLQLAVGIANLAALSDALRQTSPQERAALLRQAPGREHEPTRAPDAPK